MKILLYGINYAPELTGIGKYNGEMAQAMVDLGHDVRVVTAMPYYPQWCVQEGYSAWCYSRESLHAVQLWRCPLWVPKTPTGLKRILHLASFAISSFPVMCWQLFWRPDVVLVVEPPLFCAPTAALMARLCGAKAWLHVQDFEVDAAYELGMLRSPWLRRMVAVIERWLMRRFDRVSTISGRMLQRLSDKGVNEGAQVTFPNWVDTDLIRPLEQPGTLRNELGIAPGEIVALYSGNMGKKQGLELIVESARQLQTEAGIRFVLCGQGSAYDALRKLADGLDNILWLPLQPLARLNELLNLADIHLLPQRAGAADLVMPSKLTGMLASGRAVVATAAEGTEVWSVVQGCGINTPPGDVAAFTAAIRQLADNQDERELLGRNGRRYAEENLSANTVLGAFEKALLQVTNSLKA